MKSCKLRMSVKFNILARTNIFRWFPASPTYSHLGTVCYIAWLHVNDIQVWNQDSLDYGMESGWCRLHCKLFSGAQLLELWYRVLEALLYLLRGIIIWLSHADLSGLGLIALSYTEPALPVGGSPCSMSIISLRLGSSASLSSPFSSSTVKPFCPASLVSWATVVVWTNMQCRNIASRTNGARCIYIRNTHVPNKHIYTHI